MIWATRIARKEITMGRQKTVKVTPKVKSYDDIIAEIKNTTLTKSNITKLLNTCSNTIDEIGCELLEQYEKAYPDVTQEILTLRHQQRHLIELRDILFTTYNEIMDLKDCKPRHSDRCLMIGVNTYRAQDHEADDFGTWMS